MTDTTPLKFRVSSGLKTIIGKDLITADTIAVFELVKNAFDAHASRVDIIFKNLKSPQPVLVIADDGKGMSYDDLRNKWLFVAYSAKKDGTEDSAPERKADYRHKIYSGRVFAGAKGIGRFSCDRLGRFLTLYTTPPDTASHPHKLLVDWQEFEKNDKEEFVNVSITYSSPSEIPYELAHGTILEITDLRAIWDRKKLLELKHSLEKLINPNQENDTRGFAVCLRVEDEVEADRKEKDERRRVNGCIQNFLFEDLKLKTTRIVTAVSGDGKTITTELVDRGSLIYRVVEENPFSSLKNVTIYLFQLNRAAKLYFTRKMGVEPVGYGSVFLYKNGFRIYPFGEVGEDTLGIDHRKQQGYARFLGTRNLAGRIEIQDAENIFKETSSRDGGLIKNEAYSDLRLFFYDYALKRLEKYAVDVIKWGDPVQEFDQEALSPSQVKQHIFDIITKLTSSEHVLDVQYDPKLLNILENRSEQSVSSLLANFTRIAETSQDPKLQKEVRKAQKQLHLLAAAKDEAEKETIQARRHARRTKKELDLERKKNLFLLATSRDASPETQGLVHAVKIASTGVDSIVRDLARRVKANEFTEDILLKGLHDIRVHTQKILNISRIITRANFSLEVQRTRADLARFIFEYLNDTELPRKGLDIQVVYQDESFMSVFSAIEVSIVIDNLISNASKAHATRILFELALKGESLMLTISDDGDGVEHSVRDSMFELGISTRKGSGIGLYTCRTLMKKLCGIIKFVGNGKPLHGACFQLEFKQ